MRPFPSGSSGALCFPTSSPPSVHQKATRSSFLTCFQTTPCGIPSLWDGQTRDQPLSQHIARHKQASPHPHPRVLGLTGVPGGSTSVLLRFEAST